MSADVNHSFWVPELSPKLDLIPGQTNTLTLEADTAGTYRGQCAEYCGIQHAHMAFLVIADAPDTYARWVAQQQQPAPTPTNDQAQSRPAGVSEFGLRLLPHDYAGRTQRARSGLT